ncbi:hypothetical protein MPV89_004404 [Vibrio vulnificus]|uniref:hypothetical protein n=1 Tax=Vibrio vulnificus TaxID=672 RepID=UPI0005F1ED4B|nr:hypothetical protein [Vibrio vulnificus]EHH2451544.1 hypothetical protein [Vibrio vulnificus]EIZ4670171.1 hypothetical protein [Vibrio vulnificus]ELK2038318.1 hypothetical protein [Vibrio vulnificus]ELK2284136.1 hypothetical protein [Vibrio vulnificus]MCU8343750.1 hypothetical protein [Vibrio vulnificus]
MARKDTYKLIVEHHQKVKALYEKADTLEDLIIDANKKALDSEAFSENFANRSSDEYSDFEKEVIKLIGNLTKAVVGADISKSYKEVLESYKTVLENLEKD